MGEIGVPGHRFQALLNCYSYQQLYLDLGKSCAQEVEELGVVLVVGAGEREEE